MHDEEPDAKKIIREDSDVEVDSSCNDGVDVDAVHTTVYSKARIDLAVNRNAVTSLNKLASTDVS